LVFARKFLCKEKKPASLTKLRKNSWNDVPRNQDVRPKKCRVFLPLPTIEMARQFYQNFCYEILTKNHFYKALFTQFLRNKAQVAVSNSEYFFLQIANN